MNLPKQLRNNKFRFVKILAGQKRPAEEDWWMTNNYKHSEKEFKEYLESSDAYGVVCGPGKLAIVDCDNIAVAEVLKKELPNTFTVRTPGHNSLHFYFIIPDLTKKIIMNDVNDKHHGEVQFTGSQCLGPNSRHPNGELYEVENDAAIAKISKKQLLTSIAPFIQQEKPSKCDSGIDFDIMEVAKSLKGMDEKGGEIVGAHPIHGSEGGENFHIDPEKNVWHCFRCNTGGDAFTLIAMLEGLIQCKDCKPGALSDKTLFKKVKQIAINKYGYSDDSQFHAPKLTEPETEMLKDKNLLYNILTEIAEEGVEGEELAELTLIMKICLRLVKNSEPTSSNILVSDKTGGGKDHLTKNVCKVMLDEDKTCFHETYVSEKVLNYWFPNNNKSASWDGRVLYLEDPAEDAIKSQAFRVRASGHNKQTNLDKDRNVITIKINGKPVIIVTSMKASIDVEGMRRWDAVRIDNSNALTMRVLEYMFLKDAGLIEYNPNSTLRSAIRKLERVEVTIPFAPQLAKYIISNKGLVKHIMRTQGKKLLDYIKASAALHQHQRQRTEDGKVIATWDDYEYANIVFTVLKNIIGQATNRKEESLINYLAKCKDEKGHYIFQTYRDITNNTGITDNWLYRNCENLVEKGIINIKKEFDTLAGRDVKKIGLDETLTFHIFPKAKEIGETSGPISDGTLLSQINEKRKKINLPPIIDGAWIYSET